MAEGHHDEVNLTGDDGIDTHALPWRHNVFACPLHRDVHVPVSEYAKATDLIETGISVPGSAVPANTVSRARPCLVRLLRRSYDLFWIVRRAGFTFRGHFSLDNLVVYRSDPPLADGFVVRMTGRLHLSLYNREDAVQDDRSFVWIVRELLELSGKPVPVDIEHWLKLINTTGLGSEYLVRYHISLMDPREALSVLISFRKRLQFLRHRRPAVYASILYRMASRHGWNARAVNFSNRLLDSTREFIVRASNAKAKTTQMDVDGCCNPNVDGVEGVLTLIRHCSEHPARRYEQQMLLIVEENLPGFVSELHSAMFRAGELRFLNLENRMS